MKKRELRLSVVGLGYVGLPVAVAFASAGYSVIGFDIDSERVAQLHSGHDRNGEVPADALKRTALALTTNAEHLASANVHIITVPTPITSTRQPDLGPLISASRIVGAVLKIGDTVVYESTVYPGATEEVCVPMLEETSGMRLNTDFSVAYSPERINPGDPKHRFENIVKVVSASNEATLDLVAYLYGSVVTAGVHRADSIRTAEAAKVIENTQRDLNIALMNELALIFDRLGIRTADVLAAARTKWNFVDFTPGLVGGHCIGVDPYYLTAKAEEVGYHPEVILAGRRTNDGMGAFIARKAVKLLIARGARVLGAKVGVFGITFKENVPDLRNSRVPDIISELREFGIIALVHDPLAHSFEAKREFGLDLVQLEAMQDLDAAILAVPHDLFTRQNGIVIQSVLQQETIVLDVKSRFFALADRESYWSL